MSTFNILSQTSNKEISEVVGKRTTTDKTRTKLRPKAGIRDLASKSEILKPLIATNGFMFPYRPNITWTSTITYGTQNLTHSIQDFKYFVRNNSTTFNITGVFTCENTDTALYTLACLHFLRSVSKMHFGGFSNNSSMTTSLSDLLTAPVSSDPYVGAPPPVLLLDSYGDYMFNKLPVILESFSMSFPDDFDYVSVTLDNSVVWLPVMTQISLSVTTQNTPQKCRQFNYTDFANGTLMKKGGWI